MNGGRVLILGISGENVKRLKEGHPIHFNTKTLGLEDRDVVIMYGETESALTDELKRQGALPSDSPLGTPKDKN